MGLPTTTLKRTKKSSVSLLTFLVMLVTSSSKAFYWSLSMKCNCGPSTSRGYESRPDAGISGTRGLYSSRVGYGGSIHYHCSRNCMQV
ncbi:transmembrane protein, putative [Medicago truncatula]|nr:transmembrane protein, putative [Medicago truncatula]